MVDNNKEFVLLLDPTAVCEFENYNGTGRWAILGYGQLLPGGTRNGQSDGQQCYGVVYEFFGRKIGSGEEQAWKKASDSIKYIMLRKLEM